jgi:hypothetical protein
MGYDLHITRRQHWGGEGPEITAEEWLSYVAADTELSLEPQAGPYAAVWTGPSELRSPWLDWEAGEIFTKNPDAALMNKMEAVANALGARVQGDDGEVYRHGKPELEAPRPIWRAIYYGLRGMIRPSRIEPAPPYKVGDKMKDVWGNLVVVEAIDLGAEHGLGKVRVRRADGSCHAYGLAGDPLKPA